MPQLQHVPLLPETVRRLLLPPYMAQHVQYLKDNRSHGAAELATYVLQVCVYVCLRGGTRWDGCDMQALCRRRGNTQVNGGPDMHSCRLLMSLSCHL